MEFIDFTPHQLRKAIEIELQKNNDAKMASIIALKNLNNDPEYYEDMEKARSHKYVNKKPDGNGGWIYTYADVEQKDTANIEQDIKLKMRFDSHDLLFSYNLIGFEERIGYESTSEKALLKTKEIENNIISFKKEHTNIIDKHGNILLSKTGNNEEIIFNDKEIKIITNAEILTHTHPEDKSFSVEDVFLGLSLGIKEMRVKTPSNIYSFKISHKKESDDKYALKNKNTTFMTVLINVNEHVLSILRQKVKEGKINGKEAEKKHREMFWGMVEKSPILADDFYIEYKKVGK